MFTKQFSLLSRRAYSSVSNSLGNDLQNAKPFSELPTMKFWKVMKDSIPGGRYHNKSMRELAQLMYDDYGETFRIPAMLGKPEIVMTYNAENFEKVFRVEGVWPVRLGMDTLEYYRSTKRPEIYGKMGSLIVSQGEKWQQMRTIANPILMQPKTIKKYMKQIDEISKEFTDVMRRLRNEKSEMPGDFSNHVNTWSLESVTAVALERRLNLFDENTKDENARRLIKAIREFFERVPEFDGKASIWRYYETKEFKKLIATYDIMTDIILHYIDQALEEMQKDSSDTDHEDSVLRKLIRVDKRVAIIVASDLMLAGVDTTASGVINVMYLLAKNPDKQELLRQELMKILPEKNSKLTPEMTKNLPYLRAVFKECHRMLPITSGNARQISKDLVLSGYHIPANTHVAMQYVFELMNEKYYPQPEKFLPERWLREKSENHTPSEASNPFSFLPFGFGARSCLGRRIAELEMETFIINMIRSFKLEWHYPEMKIKSTFVNIPDSEMRFKVIDV